MTKLLLGALVAGVLYLLFWPVPIEPVAWTPPPAPALTGPYAVNDKLQSVERTLADCLGPEAIAFDAQNRLHTGCADGRLVRYDADGKNGALLANTGGRPLGLKFAPDGSLIVADPIKGLLQVAASGTIKVLATEAAGLKLGFTDDLDVTRDGVIYFSDASWKFGYHEVLADFLEHGANGRLLRHDLGTGKTEVLARDLHFPNGVALGPDEAYLLLVEEAEYRILRWWLKGEKAGRMESFFENLPGLPDNITYDAVRQRFWLALNSPRTADLDALMPYPFLRKIVYRLPAALHPALKPYGFALALDLNGKVVANLQDPSASAYAPLTSVIAHGAWLHLGSYTAAGGARLPLSAAR